MIDPGLAWVTKVTKQEEKEIWRENKDIQKAIKYIKEARTIRDLQKAEIVLKDSLLWIKKIEKVAILLEKKLDKLLMGQRGQPAAMEKGIITLSKKSEFAIKNVLTKIQKEPENVLRNKIAVISALHLVMMLGVKLREVIHHVENIEKRMLSKGF